MTISETSSSASTKEKTLLRSASHQRQEPFEQGSRARRTAGDKEIDWDDAGDAAGDGVASRKDAAVGRADARRYDPFGPGRGVKGSLQRLAHVQRNRAGDKEHVGVAGRGDEPEAEPLEIVKGVAERVNLEFAAIA